MKAWMFLLPAMFCAAADTVYLPVMEPQAVRAGRATTVRVSVRVAATPSRVELHSVDGAKLNYLGTLTDDGKAPDFAEGDHVYSGWFSLGLPAPGVQTLRATAFVNERALTSIDATLESFGDGVPLEPLSGESARLLPDAGGVGHACDELTVWAPVGANAAAVDAAVRKAGGTLAGLSPMRGYNAWRVKLPCAASLSQLQAAARALAADGFPADLVATGEALGVAITDPEQVNYRQQLETPRTHIAWNLTLGAGALVAVVDTGADLAHEDLQGRLIVGRNFANGPSDDVRDTFFHGTGMSGVVAANAFNGLGMAGGAPQARVLVVRIAQGALLLSSRQVDGIRYAASHGAAIINCSFGNPLSDNGLARAVDFANSAGALVVAGTGNHNGKVRYPAAFADTTNLLFGPTLNTQTLAVSGYGLDNAHWAEADGSGAAYGPEVDIDAPADFIRILDLNSAYLLVNGVSASTAIVSGAAALVHSVRPSLSREQLFQTLVNTASPTGFAHPDGRPIRSVDAFAAVFQTMATGSCPDCPGAPQVSVQGARVSLGAVNLNSNGSQTPSVNAAYVTLRPAPRYELRLSHSLSTFDNYAPGPLGSFNDSLSVSVHLQPYHQRGLSDPLSLGTLNAAVLSGGSPLSPAGTLQSIGSSGVFTVNGTSGAAFPLPRVLSIVLDTFTLPGRTSTKPSWGSVTIEDITPLN